VVGVRVEQNMQGGNQRRIFCGIWLVFFLQGMVPGFWFPALTNILNAQGLGSWVRMAFLVPPLGAIISPLIAGALADQRLSADRLYAYSSFIGAVALGIAFTTLHAGWSPWWFVSFLLIYSLCSGPAWGLLATIALTHLADGERRFPQVRLGATLGWMAAGVMTSYLLHADTSPTAGYAAAVTRLLGAFCAFLLPHTPPLGMASSWKSRLGLDAFSLLKQRDHAVFFLVTMLFSIPLTAFYMHAPELLKVLGDLRPTATMTLAQVSEIIAMLLVGWVMVKFRVKTVLLWALGVSVIRFLLSAYAGQSHSVEWHLWGIALHGVCYTFYFITAQVFLDRQVDPGLKGQAQGLLAFVSSGLGPLLGTFFCQWLRMHYVTPDGQGWVEFWCVLAAMISGCFILFAGTYRGRIPGKN
jgi:nucleoside transporter